MPIFNAPARPLGPPPAHMLPQPGCIVYSDDGRRIWCTNGRLVIQYPDSVQVHEIPAALLDWNLNDPRDGWAYLEVQTEGDGIGFGISAGETLPATVRGRPSGTNSPEDTGSSGSYYLPLARLAKGNITPVLAGLPCLYLYLEPAGVSETLVDASDNIMTFVDGKAATYTPWGP